MHHEEDKLQRPPHWRFRSSKPFIYLVVSLAVLTDAYLYGLIIPVLPFALTEVVHLHEEDVQKWIGILLGVYGAALFLGSPLAGYWADRAQSRRIPYLVGVITLAASTFAFSIGHTTSILLVARFVQGLSSAIVHSAGNAILAETVGDAGVGPAMGLVTLSIALGMVLGPLVGGLLYHRFGYFAVFWSAYALVGVDLLLRLLMVERKTDEAVKEVGFNSENGEAIDTTSLSLERDGRADLSLDQPRSPEYGTFPRHARHESATESLSSQQLSDPLLRASCKKHRQKTLTDRHPRLELLATPRMLAALLGDTMHSLVLTGLESILPLRIKNIFHYSSKDVALVFLILMVPLFAAPAIGHLSDKVGAKILASLGFVALAPLIILLRLVDHYDTGQVILLSVLLFSIGIGTIMVGTSVHSEAAYMVDEMEKSHPKGSGTKNAYAQAFGLMSAAYAVGSLAGPLVGGLLLERIGWDNITLGTGILCALCVVLSAYALGSRPMRMQASKTDVDELIDEHARPGSQ